MDTQPPSPAPADNRNDQWVISYRTLRRAVGIAGIVLAPVLLAGFFFLDAKCPLPPSISHFYYTNLGSYFTGTLCAVGLFLFSYRGPEKADRRAALFASFCALGIVFSPVNPYSTVHNACSMVDLPQNDIRNALHFVFAMLLFATFAYFCLFLFIRTDETKSPTPQKQVRNRVYLICGWVIIACVALIALMQIPAIGGMPVFLGFPLWIFVLEAIALLAFGVSWLIKGETFLKDK